MLEFMIIVLLNVGVSIGTKFDAIGKAYESACVGAGYEWHGFDEHYPYTYHCTGLPRKNPR